MEPTPPPDEPDVVSSEPPVGSGRSRRNIAVGVVTVAVLAAAATGVALASDSDTATPGSSAAPNAAPSGGPEGQVGPGERRGQGGMRGRLGGHRGFGGPGMFGLMGAVHGELTVPKAGGGFQTMLVQRGQATAVSAGSISVKSEDGFTATYDVTKTTLVNATRDGITSIAKNAQVVVLARKTNDGGTAVSVVDLSRRGRFDGDRDRRGPDSTQSPAPDGGSTSGSSATGV